MIRAVIGSWLGSLAWSWTVQSLPRGTCQSRLTLPWLGRPAQGDVGYSSYMAGCPGPCLLIPIQPGDIRDRGRVPVRGQGPRLEEADDEPTLCGRPVAREQTTYTNSASSLSWW